MSLFAQTRRPWIETVGLLAILIAFVVGACMCAIAAIAFVIFFGSRIRGIEFGPDWSATWAGDVDGDGIEDVVVATRQEQESPYFGSAQVFSGKTRKCLRAFPNRQWPDFLYFAPTRAGDVNGDGRDDLIVVHDLSRSVIDVLDGRELILLENALGELCEPVGDIDHDGCDDLLVAGQPGTIGPHRFVSLISGKSGDALWFVDDRDAGLRSAVRKFGYQGCVIGDVDSDGTRDFAVTTPRDGIRILSGRDGATLRDLDVVVEGLGHNLESAGDVENGRNLHLLIRRDLGRTIQVISALSGKTLLAIPNPADRLGKPKAIGDFDGDGAPDIAVTREESLWIYSGASGNEIAHLDNACFSAGRGDFDHDGRSDLLITRAGHVEVLSGRDQSVLFELDGADLEN